MVGVFVNGDMERKLEELREWMEEKKDGMRTLFRGDFNARTGKEGGGEIGEEGEAEEVRRRSKDRKRNKEEERLVEFMKESGWFILNSGVEGDEDGEWMYTGARGESMINYIIVEEDLAGDIRRMEVGRQVNSYHHLVMVWINGAGGGGREEIRKRGEEGEVEGVGMR